jgi:hypothetical protein
LLHIDLHETTDSDEVDDSKNPQPAFQQATISAVEQITHIAPSDQDGKIIGAPVVEHGVIEYPQAKYAMCSSVTGARFTTTTEVYPDSPHATSEICNDAQVTAVCAALEFALAHA